VPTLSDWADHLTTLFPEARIKKFIEMRGADGGPWRRLCALPAFWVGLMYDQGALDAAWDLVKDWDADTRDALRVAASVHALDAKVGRIDMHDLAREVLTIAEAGLPRGRARALAGSSPTRRISSPRSRTASRRARCPQTSCWSITAPTGTEI
jgi:glutamate--cysteine ligase